MNKSDFKAFQLKPELHKVLEQLKFHHPTPIQQEVIPVALKMESLIGQSHTGSGKTHAYLLPIFQHIQEDVKEVQAVITVPTRELAMQIFDEVKKIVEYGEFSGLRTRLIIGGTDKQKMIDKLKEAPQIIVGTPGRIRDLVFDGVLNLYNARTIVVDEADLLIDLGLIKELDEILVRMKKDVQMMVFSATFPVQLQHFLKKYMESPKHVHISSQGPAPEKMEHRLIPLRHRSVSELLMEATKVINPYLALLFVNKKENADLLAADLTAQGLDVGVIHGGLTPRERKRTLKNLKDLKYQYIVATDLAARGIDIPGVSHIFNAELPKDQESYLHRVGRTARAGLEGTAISFYTEEDIPLIEKLEKSGISFEAYDIKNETWVEVQDWNQRKKRMKKESDLMEDAWKQVKKRQKVKPGYKKKMKQEAEQIKRKLKRQQGKKKK